MIPALLLALLSASTPEAASAASPPTASLALIVASNRGGQGGRPPLHYADDDGAKYHRVFTTLTGAERTVLLTDLDEDTARLFPDLVDQVRSPTRVQVESAVARLARQSLALRREGAKVRFYFVYAGHGDVEKGRGFLDLPDGPLATADLERHLRAVGADESHVVLDSCNSFFVLNPRKPGGRRFATPAEAARGLAPRLPNVGVFLSTAAEGEVFEWSELQSGVFSHAVRSGLMGAADADGDRRVSYQELAAFVETASADIKNPLYRPRVFALGPNGEGAHAILDVPDARRTAIEVDEEGPVRLAIRDANGLRWLDAHKEPSTHLSLWLPATVGDRPELERLTSRPDGTVEIGATHALPTDGAARLRLSALEPARPAIANRGPGEIFQRLFARPFGPAALAAWVAAAPAPSEVADDIDGELVADEGPAPAASSPADGRTWIRRSAIYAGVRTGTFFADLSGSSVTGGSHATPEPAPFLGLVGGYEFTPYLAAEASAGWFRLSSDASHFAYPGVFYVNRQIPGAEIGYLGYPVDLSARLSLPTGRVRPYAFAGAGIVFANLEADPSDFNTTLRVVRYLRELHSGVGARLAVGSRFFLAAEGRYVWIDDARAWGSTFGLSGLRFDLQLGTRFPFGSP